MTVETLNSIVPGKVSSAILAPLPPPIVELCKSPEITLQINRPGTSEPLVVLRADGTLTYGDGYEPDVAACVFWDALGAALPGLFLTAR